MSRAIVARLSLVLLATLTACAQYQRYAPVPLAEPTVDRFLHRNLDDSTVQRFLAAQNASGIAGGWSPQQLALAALYFHPKIREQVATVNLARATEVTAEELPGVTASTDVSRATRTDEGKSTPWSVSVTSGLTLETGGKRAARRARARALTLASTLRLQSEAWQIGAVTTTQASVHAIGADREMDDAEREHTALAELLTLVRARYSEGRVTLADVAQAESDERMALVVAVAMRRVRTMARLDVARSLAVPLRAVDSLALRIGAFTQCDSRASVDFDSLGSLALHTRYDMGAALADYAVAEKDLRVEIARQYPDLTIGPGLAWDQGILRWILSLSTPGFLRSLNKGPIAEARARRAMQAARVETMQDSILVAVDSAAAACRDASRATEATRALVDAAEQSLRIAQASYARGETGQTEVAFARVAVLRATRSQHAAEQHMFEASAAFVSALGVWPAGGPRWPDLVSLTSLTTATPPVPRAHVDRPEYRK
ncbi:MAG: TolC family protein [Gemmatimonadaceae bacterium]